MTELVQKWMTKNVISVSPTASLFEADEMMREHGIRRLPVVDHGKVVGIVTKGDIREASPSDASALSVWEVNYLIAKLTISKVMTKTVLTIAPDVDVIDAADIMLNKKVSGLPVIDSAGNLVGIITESDIFRMLVTKRIEETNQPITT